MTFNWQEMGRDQFLSWLIPTALSAQLRDERELERISAATDSFQSVSITMQINGIEVKDPENFLNRMSEQYDQQVQDEARRLLDEHTRYQDAEDIVSSAFKEARESIRSQLRALGLKVEVEEEW